MPVPGVATIHDANQQDATNFLCDRSPREHENARVRASSGSRMSGVVPLLCWSEADGHADEERDAALSSRLTSEEERERAMNNASSRSIRVLVLSAVLSMVSPRDGSGDPVVFFEDSPYLSTADTPSGFYAGGNPTFLEDFEDGALNRYLPKKPPNQDQRQRWLTFLQNHKDAITAMDFFVVPTIGFRLLYVWFTIDHGRRPIIHFNVTTNPTAQWVIQQLRESFPDDSAQRYLIFDNDTFFSDEVTEAIKRLGTEPKRTAFQSPWQNGVAERWVGSCKREIADHVIVFSEEHLRRLLREYVSYYNAERVHTVIRDAPEGRAIEAQPSPGAKVVGLPRLGGLHHRYVWQEAA